MQPMLHATRQGLARVLQHWPLALPLYFFGLGLGLLQTWPLLASGAWHNPFLGRLASGGTDALADLFLAAEGAVVPSVWWLLASLMLPLLFAIGYTFVAGGILHVYAGTASFWTGCRQQFWSFAALGVLIMVLAALALGSAVAVGVLLGPLSGLVVAGLLLAVLNTLGEYARAEAVARGRRNPAVLLARALVFCWRNLGGVLLLGLLALLLQLALLALFGLLAPLVSASTWGVIWQQLALLGWIVLKLLRLGWALSYIQGVADRAMPPAREELTSVVG